MTCEPLDHTGVPFQAVHDHLLILRPQAATKTKGGIELPDAAKKSYHCGYVVDAGPEVKSVARGDFVMFEPAHAKDIMLDLPNATCLTVVVEQGVYFRMSKAFYLEAGNTMPQLDLLDVLSRSKLTSVAG